jgi:hypothetical protein
MPVPVLSVRTIEPDQLQDGGKVIGVGPQAQLKIFDFGKFGRSFAFDLRMFMCQTREFAVGC